MVKITAFVSLTSCFLLYLTVMQDQWQRKKQSKEERIKAKKAKLDPASYKSAKDVLDENERKRKRELENDSESHSPEETSIEKPREGMKAQKPKKQKTKNIGDTVTADSVNTTDSKAAENAKSEKVRLRRERKRERRMKLQANSKADVLSVEKQLPQRNQLKDHGEERVNEISGEAKQNAEPNEELSMLPKDTTTTENEIIGQKEDGTHMDNQHSSSSASSSPKHGSSSVSPASQSPSSLPSSIVPPKSAEEAPEQNVSTKLPKIDSELLKSRLQARIEALRAARKADGIDGKPARNRQELMEARRRKEKLRREHKKELRAKAKQDESAAAEAELARLRGSGSPSSIDIFSPRHYSNLTENNFSFGRVSFNDGQQTNSSLSTIIDPRKKKGPQDPRTALQALEKKQDRIASMDEKKKAEIEEKDRWLSAKMKSHGESIKDDKSLLKKTLKKKESAKARSEQKWNERVDGIQKAKDSRQRKREDNLRKRKEEKGSKGKKGKASIKKRKARPGFEGSFRARTK